MDAEQSKLGIAKYNMDNSKARRVSPTHKVRGWRDEISLLILGN